MALINLFWFFPLLSCGWACVEDKVVLIDTMAALIWYAAYVPISGEHSRGNSYSLSVTLPATLILSLVTSIVFMTALPIAMIGPGEFLRDYIYFASGALPWLANALGLAGVGAVIAGGAADKGRNEPKIEQALERIHLNLSGLAKNKDVYPGLKAIYEYLIDPKITLSFRNDKYLHADKLAIELPRETLDKSVDRAARIMVLAGVKRFMAGQSFDKVEAEAERLIGFTDFKEKTAPSVEINTGRIGGNRIGEDEILGFLGVENIETGPTAVQNIPVPELPIPAPVVHKVTGPYLNKDIIESLSAFYDKNNQNMEGSYTLFEHPVNFIFKVNDLQEREQLLTKLLEDLLKAFSAVYSEKKAAGTAEKQHEETIADSPVDALASALIRYINTTEDGPNAIYARKALIFKVAKKINNILHEKLVAAANRANTLAPNRPQGPTNLGGKIVPIILAVLALPLFMGANWPGHGGPSAFLTIGIYLVGAGLVAGIIGWPRGMPFNGDGKSEVIDAYYRQGMDDAHNAGASDNAVYNLTQLISKKPYDPAVYLGRGIAYAKLGLKDEALEDLGLAVLLDHALRGVARAIIKKYNLEKRSSGPTFRSLLPFVIGLGIIASFGMNWPGYAGPDWLSVIGTILAGAGVAMVYRRAKKPGRVEKMTEDMERKLIAVRSITHNEVTNIMYIVWGIYVALDKRKMKNDDFEKATAKIRDLYNRASDPSISIEKKLPTANEIDAWFARLIDLKKDIAKLRGNLLRKYSHFRRHGSRGEKARRLKEDFEIWIGELNKITRIIDDRVGFAERALRKGPVDIGRLVENVRNNYVKSHGLKTPDHVTLGIMPEEPVFIEGSEMQLESALLNIIDNAYTAAQKRDVYDSKVKIDVRQKGGSVEIVVTDNGKGIPARMLKENVVHYSGRLVKRCAFEDLDVTTIAPGGGVGTTEAWYVVQDHGGIIEVKSRTGGNRRGTTITVRLPLVEVSKSAVGVKEPTVTTPAPGRTLKSLLLPLLIAVTACAVTGMGWTDGHFNVGGAMSMVGVISTLLTGAGVLAIARSRKETKKQRDSRRAPESRRSFLKKTGLAIGAAALSGIGTWLVWDKVREKKPWERFPNINPDDTNKERRFREVKEAILVMLDWMIKEGYPKPDILENYAKAIRDNSEEIAAESGILLSKDAITGKVAINCKVVADILVAIKRLDDPGDLFVEWTIILEREASGFYLAPRAQRLFESRQIQERTEALAKKIGMKLTWPSKEMEEALKAEGVQDEITDLAALVLAIEVYEGYCEYLSLDRMIKSGSYSIEKARTLSGKVQCSDMFTQQLFNGVRNHFDDLSETEGDIGNIIEAQLGMLAYNAFFFGVKDISDGLVTYYVFSEFQRFADTEKGLDPVFNKYVAETERPPLRFYKDSADRLRPKVEQYLNEMDRSLPSDFRILPSPRAAAAPATIRLIGDWWDRRIKPRTGIGYGPRVVAPIVEEALKVGLPQFVTAILSGIFAFSPILHVYILFPLLTVFGIAFTLLHLFNERAPPGSKERKSPFYHLAMPLLATLAGAYISTFISDPYLATGLSIVAHSFINTVIVPVLRRFGIKVGLGTIHSHGEAGEKAKEDDLLRKIDAAAQDLIRVDSEFADRTKGIKTNIGNANFSQGIRLSRGIAQKAWGMHEEMARQYAEKVARKEKSAEKKPQDHRSLFEAMMPENSEGRRNFESEVYFDRWVVPAGAADRVEALSADDLMGRLLNGDLFTIPRGARYDPARVQGEVALESVLRTFFSGRANIIKFETGEIISWTEFVKAAERDYFGNDAKPFGVFYENTPYHGYVGHLNLKTGELDLNLARVDNLWQALKTYLHESGHWTTFVSASESSRAKFPNYEGNAAALLLDDGIADDFACYAFLKLADLCRDNPEKRWLDKAAEFMSLTRVAQETDSHYKYALYIIQAMRSFCEDNGISWQHVLSLLYPIIMPVESKDYQGEQRLLEVSQQIVGDAIENFKSSLTKVMRGEATPDEITRVRKQAGELFGNSHPEVLADINSRLSSVKHETAPSPRSLLDVSLDLKDLLLRAQWSSHDIPKVIMVLDNTLTLTWETTLPLPDDVRQGLNTFLAHSGNAVVVNSGESLDTLRASHGELLSSLSNDQQGRYYRISGSGKVTESGFSNSEALLKEIAENWEAGRRLRYGQAIIDSFYTRLEAEVADPQGLFREIIKGISPSDIREAYQDAQRRFQQIITINTWGVEEKSVFHLLPERLSKRFGDPYLYDIGTALCCELEGLNKLLNKMESGQHDSVRFAEGIKDAVCSLLSDDLSSREFHISSGGTFAYLSRTTKAQAVRETLEKIISSYGEGEKVLIIAAGDGQNDIPTFQEISELANRYPNVQAFSFYLTHIPGDANALPEGTFLTNREQVEGGLEAIHLASAISGLAVADLPQFQFKQWRSRADSGNKEGGAGPEAGKIKPEATAGAKSFPARKKDDEFTKLSVIESASEITSTGLSEVERTIAGEIALELNKEIDADPSRHIVRVLEAISPRVSAPAQTAINELIAKINSPDGEFDYNNMAYQAVVSVVRSWPKRHWHAHPGESIHEGFNWNEMVLYKKDLFDEFKKAVEKMVPEDAGRRMHIIHILQNRSDKSLLWHELDDEARHIILDLFSKGALKRDVGVYDLASWQRMMTHVALEHFSDGVTDLRLQINISKKFEPDRKKLVKAVIDGFKKAEDLAEKKYKRKFSASLVASFARQDTKNTPEYVNTVVDELIAMRQENDEYKDRIIGVDISGAEAIIDTKVNTHFRKTSDYKAILKKAAATGMIVMAHLGDMGNTYRATDKMPKREGAELDVSRELADIADREELAREHLRFVEDGIRDSGPVSAVMHGTIVAPKNSVITKGPKKGNSFAGQAVESPENLAKIEDMLQYMREKGIEIMTCPTANTNTGKIAMYKGHPLHQWLAKGNKVSINVDDFYWGNVRSTLSDDIAKMMIAAPLESKAALLTPGLAKEISAVLHVIAGVKSFPARMTAKKEIEDIYGPILEEFKGLAIYDNTELIAANNIEPQTAQVARLVKLALLEASVIVPKTGPPIQVHLLGAVPTNVSKYADTQGGIHLLLDREFIFTLLRNKARYPNAIPRILAERFAHELSHGNVIQLPLEEREEEIGVIINADLPFYRILIDNPALQAEVDRFFDETGTKFGGRIYYKELLERIVDLPEDEISAEVEQYVDEHYDFNLVKFPLFTAEPAGLKLFPARKDTDLTTTAIWHSNQDRLAYVFDHDDTVASKEQPISRDMAVRLARLIYEKDAKVSFISGKSFGEQGRMREAAEDLRAAGKDEEAQEIEEAIAAKLGLMEFALKRIVDALSQLSGRDMTKEDLTRSLAIYPSKASEKYTYISGKFVKVYGRHITESNKDVILETMHELVPDLEGMVLDSRTMQPETIEDRIRRNGVARSYSVIYGDAYGISKVLIFAWGREPERDVREDVEKLCEEATARLAQKGLSGIRIETGAGRALDFTASGKTDGIEDVFSEGFIDVRYYGDEPQGNDKPVFDMAKTKEGLTFFDVSHGKVQETARKIDEVLNPVEAKLSPARKPAEKAKNEELNRLKIVAMGLVVFTAVVFAANWAFAFSGVFNGNSLFGLYIEAYKVSPRQIAGWTAAIEGAVAEGVGYYIGRNEKFKIRSSVLWTKFAGLIIFRGFVLGPTASIIDYFIEGILPVAIGIAVIGRAAISLVHGVFLSAVANFLGTYLSFQAEAGFRVKEGKDYEALEIRNAYTAAKQLKRTWNTIVSRIALVIIQHDIIQNIFSYELAYKILSRFGLGFINSVYRSWISTREHAPNIHTWVMLITVGASFISFKYGAPSLGVLAIVLEGAILLRKWYAEERPVKGYDNEAYEECVAGLKKSMEKWWSVERQWLIQKIEIFIGSSAGFVLGLLYWYCFKRLGVDPALAAIAAGMQPVASYLIATKFSKSEKVNYGTLIAAITATLGICFFSSAKILGTGLHAGSPGAIMLSIGVLLLLFHYVAFSFQSVYAHKVQNKYGVTSTYLTILGFGCAIVMGLAAQIIYQPSFLLHPINFITHIYAPALALTPLLFIYVLNDVVKWNLQNYSLRHIGSSHVQTVLTLVPIAVFLIAPASSLRGLAGTFLIMMAMSGMFMSIAANIWLAKRNVNNKALSRISFYSSLALIALVLVKTLGTVFTATLTASPDDWSVLQLYISTHTFSFLSSFSLTKLIGLFRDKEANDILIGIPETGTLETTAYRIKLIKKAMGGKCVIEVVKDADEFANRLVSGTQTRLYIDNTISDSYMIDVLRSVKVRLAIPELNKAYDGMISMSKIDSRKVAEIVDLIKKIMDGDIRNEHAAEIFALAQDRVWKGRRQVDRLRRLTTEQREALVAFFNNKAKELDKNISELNKGMTLAQVTDKMAVSAVTDTVAVEDPMFGESVSTNKANNCRTALVYGNVFKTREDAEAFARANRCELNDIIFVDGRTDGDRSGLLNHNDLVSRIKEIAQSERGLQAGEDYIGIRSAEGEIKGIATKGKQLAIKKTTINRKTVLLAMNSEKVLLSLIFAGSATGELKIPGLVYDDVRKLFLFEPIVPEDYCEEIEAYRTAMLLLSAAA